MIYASPLRKLRNNILNMGSKQNNFYYYIKQMENISEKSEKMGD